MSQHFDYAIDTAGNAISGATVTFVRSDGKAFRHATSESGTWTSGTIHSVTTDSEGFWQVFLSPGEYTITTSRAGYSTKIVTDVTISGEWEIALTGNLTSQTASIPLANLNGSTFSLTVEVEAKDNTTLTSTQNHTWQVDALMGYNASAGNVVIQGSANVYLLVQGNPVTVTYTVSGENILVNFAGSDYSNANAYARVFATIRG